MLLTTPSAYPPCQIDKVVFVRLLSVGVFTREPDVLYMTRFYSEDILMFFWPHDHDTTPGRYGLGCGNGIFGRGVIHSLNLQDRINHSCMITGNNVSGRRRRAAPRGTVACRLDEVVALSYLTARGQSQADPAASGWVEERSNFVPARHAGF